MRRALLFTLLFGCGDGVVATVTGAVEPPAPPVADAPALTMNVAPHAHVHSGMTETIHVEIPQRASLESVLVIEATKTPLGIDVDQGIVGMRETGVDLVVHVDALPPIEAIGRIQLALTSTRGTESAATVLIDVDGAPGALDFVTSLFMITSPRAVAISPAGPIYVGGGALDQAVVQRLHPDGGEDAAFGRFGRASVFPEEETSSATSAVESLAIAADGAIYVGGSRDYPLTFTKGRGTPFVRRMRADGTIDPSFVVAPPQAHWLGGLAIDEKDRVVAAFEDADAWIDIVAFDASGAIVGSNRISPRGGSLGGVFADAQHRVHLFFVDGTVTRLDRDLAVAQTTKVAAPIASAAMKSNGEIAVVREERISAGDAFHAEDAGVLRWATLAVDNDGKIVAAGSSSDGGSTVARFWP